MCVCAVSAYILALKWDKYIWWYCLKLVSANMLYYTLLYIAGIDVVILRIRFFLGVVEMDTVFMVVIFHHSQLRCEYFFFFRFVDF